MLEHTLPTRQAGLERLARFVPRAGRDYAAKRNYDLPDQGHPHVSALSPYLRHRLLTEEEVLEAVLGRYALSSAEKFVQEVCWRTYWKGWLELRPQIWGDYAKAIAPAIRVDGVAEAEAGRTPIAPFNAWAQELVETGYLHNHARMWFASIWIFTLKLPWQAGADFFLRHLLDGDPASNTLSWRWVAGLQTRGKHYLARPANIAKYTEGRHGAEGLYLNTQADPLSGHAPPDRRPPPTGDEVLRGGPTAILLHEDDLSPGYLFAALDDAPLGHAALLAANGRSPGAVDAKVTTFALGAIEDARARWQDRLGPAGPITEDISDLVAWARDLGVDQVLTAYAPVGPVASRLMRLRKSLEAEGITLKRHLRPWDRETWPHATHGFFRFKEHIPEFVDNFVGS